jgi:uncharacterized protein with PQ loop repeat
MNEPIRSLTLFLLINSIFVTVLILNQNESSKDSANKEATNSSFSPFEKFTWISVVFQLILLLMKIKISDS